MYRNPLPSIQYSKADELPASINGTDVIFKWDLGEDGNPLGEYTLTKVETEGIGRKTIRSSPKHGGKAVTFSHGALMYKWYGVDRINLPSLAYLRENCRDIGMACGDVQYDGNKTEVRWGSGNLDIILNADNTYNINVRDAAYKYPEHAPFGYKETPPQGRYVKSLDVLGDVITFKGANDENLFMVFKKDAQSGYYIAGEFRHYGENVKICFNKIAAQDIQRQW